MYAAQKRRGWKNHLFLPDLYLRVYTYNNNNIHKYVSNIVYNIYNTHEHIARQY